jgi:hypothetical protein
VPGRHDGAALRRSTRHGRRRGCSIHLSGEELEAAGLKPTDPPPLYRVWVAKGRPRLVVNLYREP